MITYGSVCSGIEAATVAWEPLGWKPAFFSEIESFPRAVLAHRWPGVTCHGDFQTIGADDYGPIDLLVGGTPCQSFSVAGLRGGLADKRGNLALEYLRLADRKKPRWILWENVPGVLSSGNGRDFGAFLGGLVELGYGFAYRVLDAQYFGLAQRRKRVFVVGYLGDWRRAAAVLFEPASLRGDSAPSRATGQAVAPTLEAGANRTGGDRPPGTTVDTADSLIANPLGAKKDGGWRGDLDNDTFAVVPLLEIGKGSSSRGDGPNGTGLGSPGDPMFTLQAGAQHGVAYRTSGNCGVWETGDRIDALTTGTDRTSSVVAFHENQRGEVTTNDTAGSLKVGGGKPGQGYPAIASFQQNSMQGRGTLGYDENSEVLRPVKPQSDHQMLQIGSAVRRLTPLECCRLQGFPDDYLDITYRGKVAADGPRYKALGNSMAVPCMAWIGRRITQQEIEIRARGDAP